MNIVSVYVINGVFPAIPLQFSKKRAQKKIMAIFVKNQMT